jgi:hypothetical protein
MEVKKNDLYATLNLLKYRIWEAPSPPFSAFLLLSFDESDNSDPSGELPLSTQSYPVKYFNMRVFPELTSIPATTQSSQQNFSLHSNSYSDSDSD